MAIILKVIDEDGELYAEPVMVDEDGLRNLIKIAHAKDLKCLNFVDAVGDTFFNEKQLHHIKKEIDLLRKDEQVEQKVLDNIEKAVNEALKDALLYLKFEGE